MEAILKDALCDYLGQLMAERDATFDWIEKDGLIQKINAVNLILGFEHKEETWFEKVATNLHSLTKKC